VKKDGKSSKEEVECRRGVSWDVLVIIIDTVFVVKSELEQTQGGLNRELGRMSGFDNLVSAGGSRVIGRKREGG